MAKYPCVACSLECRDDTIRCNQCMEWVHGHCIGLSSKDLDEWSVTSLKFLCRNCAFSGNEFDCRLALKRLEQAKRVPGLQTLVNVARSEERLLKTYGVSINVSDIREYNRPVDRLSVEILRKYHPAMADQKVPLATIGDGNCFYRAACLALTGTEEQHMLLRLLVALEMILNRSYYESDFIQDRDIFEPDANNLIDDSLKPGVYSEFCHFFPLSAVVGKSINSYYPPQVQHTFTSRPYTRRVTGRGVKDMEAVMCLMWTQMTMPKAELNPNHFVPLVGPEQNETHGVPVRQVENGSVLPGATVIDANNFVNIVETELPHQADVESDLDETELPHQAAASVADVATDLTSTCQFRGTLGQGFLNTGAAVNLLTKTAGSGLDAIPGGIKENCYFLIANKENLERRERGKKSYFSDDCGVWSCASGASPKTHYMLGPDGELTLVYYRKKVYCTMKRVQGRKEYTPMDPQPEPNSLVIIQRYYAKSKQDPNYSKRVTWLGEGGLRSHLALVEYVGKFPGLAAHGNAIESTEYIRTPSVVMAEAKKMVSDKNAKQVYDILRAKYDVMSGPSSVRQIQDLKSHKSREDAQQTGPRKNIADHIMTLQNMVSDNHPYVRTVIHTGKTPCIILYTDEQMQDLSNFCSPGHTILGVDKTFNLCDMHVTVTCYKQLSVVRHRRTDGMKGHPIFLGPLYIHDTSDFESYCHFFLHLKMKLSNSPLDKLVIGSDDESALVKAIETAFPESTHVLCTRHLRQNANQKLTDDAVNMQDRTDILNKIFGIDGITASDNRICFEAKCDDLEQYSNNISQQFVRYFQSRLRPLLRKKVNQPLLQDSVPPQWTNNNCEAINHVLKTSINWKAKPLTDLVTTVHGIVKGQFNDLPTAQIGAGEFRLADSHREFELTKTRYLQMTDSQRQRQFNRFRRQPILREGYVTSTNGQSTIVAPRAHGKKPGQNKRRVNVRTTTQSKKKKENSTDLHE